MDGSGNVQRRVPSAERQPDSLASAQLSAVPWASAIGAAAQAHAQSLMQALPSGAHLILEVSAEETARLALGTPGGQVALWGSSWSVESVRARTGAGGAGQILLRKHVPLGGLLSAAVVSRRQGYGFVSSPKCGNTAIKVALWALEASRQTCDPLVRSMDVHVSGVQPGSPWLTYGQARPTEIADALERRPYLFAVVRNPFDRAISAYKGTAERDDLEHTSQLNWAGVWPPSFAEFLEALAGMDPSDMDIHWRPLADILQPKQVGYSRLLTTERLSEQFTQAWHELGGEGLPPLPHLGVSQFALDEVYNAHTEALVRQIYAEDFHLFGYSLDRADRYADPEKLWRLSSGHGASRLVLDQLRAMH